MRKIICLTVVLLLVSLSAAAQDSSKVDVFGGYSYLRYTPGSGTFTANYVEGGIGSVAYNVGRSIGVVGEVSANHNGSVYGTIVSSNVVTYLVGPKVFLHVGNVTPFAQALFGGAHATASDSGASSSANAFAASFGTGLDLHINRQLDVRLIQVDDLMTTFSSGQFNGFGGGIQNGLRISSGVVFRL